MQTVTGVPEILLVRVRAASDPYAAGDELALAFNDPEIARLATLAGGRVAKPQVGAVAALENDVAGSAARPAPPIPRAVHVEVTLAAPPYATGDILALWFVDPRFARIAAMRVPPGDLVKAAGIPPAVASPRVAVGTASDVALAPSAPLGPGVASLASVRLHWGGDRVRRFVQVVDRLFTVDRLGWYRHALAMRLLVPDEIRCGDPALDATAASALQALRDAAVETLGGPLLEAFMPNFTVTAEWLDALDAPAGARALAHLRTTIESINVVRSTPVEFEPESESTVGTIFAAELSATAGLSLDAMLPVLIPYRSSFPEIDERLAAYRHALIELFGQTARSAKLVRLTQMAEPCHALDDRLWQLVGTIGESFGGLTAG